MLLDELRAAGVALYIGNRVIGQDRASRMLFGIQSTLDEDVKLGILERRRRVDRADWVWLDVPAIITRPTFDAAQAQLQKNYERSNRHMRSECQYFLRGRWFKCAACQGAMYGHTQTQKKKGRSYRYYACTSRANPNKDKRCKGSIRGDDADGQVWSAVVSFLLTPAAVLKHMEAHQNRASTKQEHIAVEQDSIQRALEECDHDDAKWKHAYDVDAIDALELRQYRAQIGERRQRLQEQADSLQARLNTLALSAQQAQRLVRYTESLVQGYVDSHVETIVKAVKSGHDADLDASDAILADELRERWDDWGKRRVGLEALRQATIGRVLSSQRAQVRAQLDALSVLDKQALLDQLGIVAYWTRGERLKIVGNIALG